LTVAGAGALVLTGASTYTGTTTINSGGTLRLSGVGQLELGNCTNTVTVNGTFDNSGTAGQILAGVVAGTNSILQNGSGELIFSATNSTFTGTITVNAGAIGAGAANGLPTNSTLNLNGGTVHLANNATIKALQYAGVYKAAGTYGAIGSIASHQSAQFTGTGILTVTAGGTSVTAVTCDANSKTVGQSVAFTITVTGTGDGTIPDGTVDLSDNGTPIATGLPLTPTTGTSAVATYATSTLGLGAHPMTATWTGNDSYGTSTSAVYTQNVVQPPVITSPTTASTITTNAGTTLLLPVTVQDATGVSYQWQKGGVNLNNGSYSNAATVVGATTPCCRWQI